MWNDTKNFKNKVKEKTNNTVMKIYKVMAAPILLYGGEISTTEKYLNKIKFVE